MCLVKVVAFDSQKKKKKKKGCRFPLFFKRLGY